MHKANRIIGSSTRGAWIVAVVVTQSLLPANETFALPTNGKVGAGEATITTPSPTTMLIGQGSNHAIINWNSFGIGTGEAVNITQPAVQSTLLNRVLGNDPSSIFGTLTANGRVFIVNPNGMLFAPGASVNVGGLVASSLAINDSDFLSQKYSFFRNGATGSVVNQGSLTGGFVALLSNNLTNTGNIITTKGSTGLAVGDGVILALDTTGLVSIKVDQTAYNARITNSGVIEADGGTVLISASAANDLLGTVVNNCGKVRASSMTERDGKIVIEGGSVINTGTLSASDINANMNNLVDAGIWNAEGSNKGGSIQFNATGSIEQTAASRITADGENGGIIRIEAGKGVYLSGTLNANGNSGNGGQIAITAPQTLLAGAQLSADGLRGGGSIFIGGGWQGKDATLANAKNTAVTKSSRLNANALDNGNGGTVALWSEQSTAFAGIIEAKGGKQSGNGGKVEVSGHENLNISGQVVMTAPYGKSGVLLLDPRNITIDANATPQLFSVIPLPDPNPAAGNEHGSGNIFELQNGNIVVASPLDDFAATNAGAVRLYKPDGTLLSVLSGSTANDQVGEKVTLLTGNNNAVALTRKWSNAGQAGVGAVTWIDGTTGISGSVSDANSLVGSALNDGLLSTLTTLTNGNYVVASPSWNNGVVIDAGAVTWGNGTRGTTGVVSALNSLVGSTANDGVSSKVTALTNGNYIVSSSLWDKGAVANVGAVTWANGLGGTVGQISATNSLVGSKTGDNVGIVVTALTNGHYVVGSPNWDNGAVTNAGAATWVNGSTGAIGTLSAANSLVGPTANDKVGSSVTALSNGNYVVNSPTWDNGSTVDAGATTWGDGARGTIGMINIANSLTGSTTNDGLSSCVVALTNGNYVIGSPNWDKGLVVNAGAVTWGEGLRGTVGTISETNSLVGFMPNDGTSMTVTALTNGNYVAASPRWDNATTADVGAVSWGNGTAGTIGTISAANSLIGSTLNDNTLQSITPLKNGNYVVDSPYWDSPATTDAGAVTWGNGLGGTVGTISAANSLIGSIKYDFAKPDNTGSNVITALTNGNYVVSSPGWDRGTATNAGAVTFGSGLGGTVGEINITNSLVGTKSGDQVGSLTTALPNGNYVTGASNCDNGSLSNAGAVTFGNGIGGLIGTVNSTNSILGSRKDDLISSGGFTPLTVGSMNGSFVVSSMNWSNNSGLVEIISPQFIQNSLQQEYASNAGTDNILTPTQITAFLNAGENVILQANNDLIVNSAIVTNNPLGNGGNLALNAGQRILINADITTDNGNLQLISNETLANGIVDSWRSTGNAVITMATGTTIDAGTGSVSIDLRDGEGLTNRESGDITLHNISAGTISAINYGPTSGSGITLSGTLAANANSGNSIVLAGKDFDNSAGSILSTTGTARWLVYSDNPVETSKGGLTSDFRHYNGSNSNYSPAGVNESGNGFIYATLPGQLLVNTTLASGKASSYYGNQPDATYGYTLTGFADSEDNSHNIGIHGTMVVSGAPAVTSNAGMYTINYDSGFSSGSGFTFTAGAGLAYTIEKQPIDISANGGDKTYGTSDPTLTWGSESQNNGRGLLAGDSFNGELSRMPGENVGSYAILQNTLDNSNYAINFTSADLTINQRPITLRATTVSRIYGETDPALSVSITDGSLGTVSVSDVLSDITGSLGRQTGTNIGTYDITLGSGSKAGNYAITFANDNNAFSITKRPVNIAAIPLSKIYGDADPMLTWQAEAQYRTLNMLTRNFYQSTSAFHGININYPSYNMNLIEQASELLTGATPTTSKSNNTSASGDFIAVDTMVVPEPAETFFARSLKSLFTNSNPDAIISLEVRSENGTSIPYWMSFDPTQKILSGTAPKEAIGDYRLELVAKDQFGGEVRTVVLVKIG